MQSAMSFLREAHWLDATRVRGYSRIVLLGYVAGLVWFYHLALTTSGSDFQAFWGGARAVLEFGPTAAYDLDAQRQIQSGLGPGEVFPFINPPPFLFVVLPFGFLGYPLAWIVWVVLGFAIWATIAIRAFPRLWPLAIAFPGTFLAAIHAQNGFVTGALLIAGTALVTRRPWLAGLAIGALVIKPHLALLAPFWLAAGQKWDAFVAAAISAIALTGMSLLVFGVESLEAMRESLTVTGELLQDTPDEFYLRMVTVYGQVRLYFGEGAALAVSGVVTLAMIGLVMLSWRRFDGDDQASGALFLAAIPLATPYLFSYDLAFLVIPLMWLTWDNLKRGFGPWDKLILLALFFSPLAVRALALPLQLNLMPLVSIAMVWLIWQRGPLANRQSEPQPA
ncbi:Protein of unknown function [Altererythrobacter xiamenensis]|uniref:DUF2029 domain-containing protein n=1 Tax=Altererythrobacter xiamenensis TaxID=1316679 RepID=A0A1Y6F499_9SPHN|nr:glycosyltransferase family 87 protein [Altererythrobacter xiamenensis]SMQ69349.1 Protein of unknown function [Altererythrobacter xiamenensis]